MGVTIHEGQIGWVPDRAGVTAATAYPSGGTAGVPMSTLGRASNRVHIGVDYTVASGTMSLTVPVYGYTVVPPNGVAVGSNTWISTSTWVYLGSLNNGASITADTSKWSQSATRITLSEVFSVSGENYSRLATGVVPGGTSPVVSTYIGFCQD